MDANSESKPQSNRGVDRAKSVLQRIGPTLKTDLAKAGLQLGDPVFLRIFKEERTLELWMKKGQSFQLFRTYRIAGMSGKLGPKLAEGDYQAPEGFYFVTPAQLNPQSNYHLSFNIGFPNEYDQAKGRTGSFIMVHGSKGSSGCFAMTDEKIEEIYTLCAQALHSGQDFFRVHIFPFKMTVERLDKEKKHPWHSFWVNLHEGYLHFEDRKIPPNVKVKGGRYVFSEI